MKFKGNSKSDPGSTFPAGDYFLTCTNVQDTDKNGYLLKSKQGNDMWVLEFTVAEGEYKDRKLWHYLVWLPEGTPGHGMALRAIHAFGLDPEGEADYAPQHFLGVTVKATVEVEQGDPQYQAKNRIKRWHVPEGAEQRRPAPEQGDAQEPGNAPEDFPPPKLAKPVQRPAAAAPAQAKRKPLWAGKK